MTDQQPTLPPCICGSACTIDNPEKRYREWACGTSMWIEQVGPDRWKAGIQSEQCRMTVDGRSRVEQHDDVCDTCGHLRSAHIYHEGACRPGHVCPSRCETFVMSW